MTSAERLSLRARLVEEVIDEMETLEGGALDEFLVDAGFDPATLLIDFELSLLSTNASPGRLKFEAARASLRNKKPNAQVVHLNAARKRQVFDAIKQRMAATNDMTLAARNQKIDFETDLDRFLEACIGLGIIDENGDMKD
jgi:hypothetical protein